MLEAQDVERGNPLFCVAPTSFDHFVGVAEQRRWLAENFVIIAP